MPNAQIINMLKTHEGYRMKVYKCTAGKRTIGYGWNLDSKKMNKATINDFNHIQNNIRLLIPLWKSGQSQMPLDLAEKILIAQAKQAKKEAQNSIKKFESLCSNRQDVLIDMCFNLGITRFKKFKQFIKAINNKDYQEAKKQMQDSRWYHQVGKRAKSLCLMMEQDIDFKQALKDL